MGDYGCFWNLSLLLLQLPSSSHKRCSERKGKGGKGREGRHQKPSESQRNGFSPNGTSTYCSIFFFLGRRAILLWRLFMYFSIKRICGKFWKKSHDHMCGFLFCILQPLFCVKHAIFCLQLNFNLQTYQYTYNVTWRKHHYRLQLVQLQVCSWCTWFSQQSWSLSRLQQFCDKQGRSGARYHWLSSK